MFKSPRKYKSEPNRKGYMIHKHENIKSVTERDKKFLRAIALVLDDLFKVAVEESGLPKCNCHSICRALAIIIPQLKVVDGLFLGLSQKKSSKAVRANHSWLLTPDRAIIDPYPVGIISMSPLLVPTKGKYSSFYSGFFFKGTLSSMEEKRLKAGVASLITLYEKKHKLPTKV